MGRLEKAVHVAVHTCLNIRRGEQVVVVADDPKARLGQLFYQAASHASHRNAVFVQIPELRPHRIEIPTSLPELFAAADVLILLTSVSLSHTDARRRACRRGTRAVSLPGITAETLARAVDVDYDFIVERSRRLADIFSIGSRMHVTTPAGTDLQLQIRRRRGYADTGLVHEAGQFSNLPAGEASVSPQEDKAEGIVVIESGMGLQPGEGKTITMRVRAGRAARIEGGEEAHRLSRLLSSYGPAARVLAEFGVGTNPRARVVGLTLEDEKALGTAHVALGNNVSFGGKNNVGIHVDGIMLKPTVEIDDRLIIKDGEFVL